ncbi:MAG: M1 family aminopeptidase, partial [Candidatus Heimdallarchaeota archaeon]
MNYLENLSCLNKKSNFGSKHAKLHYRPHLELEPYHQILDLTIDILKKYVSGSVTTKIVARKTGKNLKIELNGINLKIESIKSVTEDTKEFLNVSWSYNDDIINCKWKKDWIKGEKRDLIIFYSIKAPVGGLYFSSPTNNEPDKPVFVHADHETERARYWLPCIDHPSVRCTLDINLTSHKEYSILANGRLIRESETNNDTKTAHWKLDIPCPSYLITLCIGDLVTYKDRDADFGYGPIPTEYFTSKRYISDNLRITFSKTPEMIEWMRNKLGKLEYPKYFQYALPQVSGAMENISLVSWDDFVILDEIFAKEISWNIDQTNVHELAHSWFGDVVVMKDF